jgi:hypothetical protein
MKIIKVLDAHVTNEFRICHYDGRLSEFEHASKFMGFQLIVLILKDNKSSQLGKYQINLFQTSKTSAKARVLKIVFAMFPKNGTGLTNAIPFFAQWSLFLTAYW